MPLDAPVMTTVLLLLLISVVLGWVTKRCGFHGELLRRTGVNLLFVSVI
jgi:hypothetical protein